MNSDSYEVKYQYCNLCDALHRNINDNFESVSFDIDTRGEIQVQVVLLSQTSVELDYIDDLMCEFFASQQRDIVKMAIVTVDSNRLPLENIVYARRH
jgi:hypothetical protein